MKVRWLELEELRQVRSFKVRAMLLPGVASLIVQKPHHFSHASLFTHFTSL